MASALPTVEIPTGAFPAFEVTEEGALDALDGLDSHPDVPELASPLPASRQPTQSGAGSHFDGTTSTTSFLDTRLSASHGLAASSSSRAAAGDSLLSSVGFGQMGTLLWSQREESVVRNRKGSVLTRGLILKTDHFAGGARSAHLDLHLQGAPNFRKADCSLEVYGVAQPSITGLKTILSVLKARPAKESSAAAHAARTGSTDSPFTLSAAHSPAEGILPGWSPTASPNVQPTRATAASAANATAAGASRHTKPATQRPRKCVWVCTREEPVIYVGGRPFVLREAERPLTTFGLSMRANNLEAIELRLKQDILREAARYGGLLMVHEETASGEMSPTWIAVDSDSIYTVREVWNRVKDEGWSVDYHRIPISEDQAIENNYLDAYTQVIKDLDPTQTSLVANCGIGFTRTTFAMVAAVILRRKQMLLNGHPDPFAEVLNQDKSPLQTAGLSTPNSSVAKSIRQASEQHAHNRTLLRLIRVLNESLSTKDSQSTIEILLSQPALLEALRKANSGDYGVIRQLSGLLDEGLESKTVVDAAVDSCAHVTNLRETILQSRIRYSTDALDEAQSTYHLEKAAKSLEKYFFLVAFASYVNASRTATFQHRFASWLKNRVEIWRGITLIRSKGRKLYFFDPVSDLSVISKGAAGDLKASSQRLQGRFGEVSGQGAQVPGDEFAEYVIRNRAGVVLRPLTLLKCDIWRKFIEKNAGLPVRGTVNFRRIPGSNIFATGQPTVEGIRNVVSELQEYYASNCSGADSYDPTTVTWINLREEPLVYVNGKPYCLRQKGMSLRNIKAYSGINWDRLLLLEDRLKNDVLNELNVGEGRLLLHTETADGTVVPIWEEAAPHDVDTIQGIMTQAELEWKDKVQLRFRRIPMTAEKPPDFSDISELLSVVLKANVDRSPIVLNCQLGRGRSTMTAVLILMIARWLEQHKPVYNDARIDDIDAVHPQRASKDGGGLSRMSDEGEDHSSTPIDRHVDRPAASSILEQADEEARDASDKPRREPLSYHVINSLLRVIPTGLEVKRIVDDCIDQCSGVTNLRDAIEDSRLAAEDTENEAQRRKHIQSAIHNLRRYFELIIFQSYLSQTKPDLLQSQSSFRSFVTRQPVFNTIAKDFEKIDIATIMPLQKVDPSDGVALSDEVQDVVSHRNGSILSAYTMLKSDFFSGILKLGLPERIEGMPNLRGVPLLLAPPSAASAASGLTTPQRNTLAHGRETWGSGMPTVDGLRRGLTRMGASPTGPATVVWTSLREEPVLYVNGRPHVLRLADQPVTNIEATGVTTDVVEGMEVSLKNDMLNEARQRDGRVLLHDEVEIRQGEFDIIPVWETVKDGDVLTPREVYELVQREGFKVDYARLAITDEQAPVPAVFSQLEERVIRALQTGSACVFNCQMGRGRTTTGMVIASLVSTVWQFGDEMVSGNDINGSILFGSAGGGGVADEPEFGNPKDALDNREDDLWLQGEWRTILQLVGVLSHGKLAKRLTDKAVDRMEAVQNLRKAIYDSKLRADNAESGSKKYKHLRSVFVNYLQRYGYLIAFANYLLEKSDAGAFHPLPRFSTSSSSSSSSDGEEDDHAFFSNPSSTAGNDNMGAGTSRRNRSESISSELSTSTSMTSGSLIASLYPSGQGAMTRSASSLYSAGGMGGASSTMPASSLANKGARAEVERGFPTFLAWLQPRREILSILGRKNLE